MLTLVRSAVLRRTERATLVEDQPVEAMVRYP